MRRPSREQVLQFGAGALLGFFTWIGYGQLSLIDLFAGSGLNGLFVCMLLGGLVYLSSARAIMWASAGGLAFMMLVVGYTPIMRGAAHSLIRSDPVTTVDAVVVLSSSVSEDRLLDPQAVDRLLTGMELVGNGVAPNLVVTSISVKGAKGNISSLEDQTSLVRLGGGRVNLFSTAVVSTTHDEAIEVARIAQSQRWTSVAVVTSPLHTKRACATFEKQGLKVVCFPARSRDVAVGALRGSSDRLRAFQLWLYESLATSEYRRRGWI